MHKFTPEALKKILVVLTILIYSCFSYAAENLLLNPSFENPTTNKTRRPSVWFMEKSSPETTGAVLIRIEDAVDGQVAAKIIMKKNLSSVSPAGAIFSPAIDIEYGTYILTGWYKSSGKTELSVNCATIDKTGMQFESSVKKLPYTKEWKKFTMPLHIYSHCKPKTGYLKKYMPQRLSIQLQAKKAGLAYFDNLSLTRCEDNILLRIYPAEFARNNSVPLIRNMPSFLKIMLSGDKSKVNGEVKIIIDMPENIGDFGLLGGGKKITIHGQKSVRYEVAVPPATIKRMKKTTGHAAVMLWFDVTKSSKPGNVYYRVAINGKLGFEKQVTVKLLDKISDGRRPKRFKSIFFWGTFANASTPKKLYQPLYKMIKSMGITDYLITSTTAPEGWIKYVIDHIKQDGGSIWANTPRGFSFGHETERIARGTKGVDDSCGDYYRQLRVKIDTVSYDYEPANAQKNPRWDDEQTKKAFAEKFGYKLADLTREKIKGELKEQWLTFRTWQIGEALRIWAKYVHSLNPELNIAVSQGDGYPTYKYVDYAVYADIPKLINMPQIYTGKPIGVINNIIAMQQHYKKPRLFPIVTSYMVADKGWKAQNSPKNIYSYYTSAAMLGCMGCAHWPDIQRGMDMEYIWEVARAMGDIAYLEDYAYDGKPINDVVIEFANNEINWQENHLFRAYRLKGKILLAFNNLSENNIATVKLKLSNLAKNNWLIIDPVSKKPLLNSKNNSWTNEQLANGITLTIPAATLKMLEFRPAEN